MIQIIVALGVAIWFFRSARAGGRSPFGWAVLGALAVVLPSFVWAFVVSMMILPAVIGSGMGDTQTVMLAALVGLVGVAMGGLLAWWLHRRYLAPAASGAHREAVRARSG